MIFFKMTSCLCFRIQHKLKKAFTSFNKELDIYLNIYDIDVGVGAFHTGTEIDGVEYSYGYTKKGTGASICTAHPFTSICIYLHLFASV